MIVGKNIVLTQRLLKLVRLYVSFRVACPYCIEMNSYDCAKYKISEEEILVLQNDSVNEKRILFSTTELLAIAYAKLLTQTPVQIPQNLLEDLRRNFSYKEIVSLGYTISQVNFWARMIQGLGVTQDTCKMK